MTTQRAHGQSDIDWFVSGLEPRRKRPVYNAHHHRTLTSPGLNLQPLDFPLASTQRARD